MQQLNNISPDWKGSTRFERRFIQRILKHEGTGKAIVVFSRECDRLTDYWYWFLLGTLWVSYSGWSDLALWRRLFSSKRGKRSTSLMKPDEYAIFQSLPPVVTAYRAHRPNEQIWFSYTLNPTIAARFALERGVKEVSAYTIPREEVLALFLRRGEAELLVLDQTKATHCHPIDVVVNPVRDGTSRGSACRTRAGEDARSCVETSATPDRTTDCWRGTYRAD